MRNDHDHATQKLTVTWLNVEGTLSRTQEETPPGLDQPQQTRTRTASSNGTAPNLENARRNRRARSLDFSRSNARGRSDLRSPDDAWTSKTHDNPGILRDRRGMNAASSPFRKNGVSRLAATGRSGFREQIDGIGWPRATLCIDTRDPRDEASVPPSG